MSNVKPHNYLNTNTPFLPLVEARWNFLRLAPSCTRNRSWGVRKTTDELIIEIETSEAKASIIAYGGSQSLEIVFRRFKNERTLCQGICSSEVELVRKLNSLITELSASPFAYRV